MDDFLKALREEFTKTRGTWSSKKFAFSLTVILVALLLISYFTVELRAVQSLNAKPTTFEITPGEGFRAIANRLAEEHLIRSSTTFELLSLLTGSATKLKPGTYELNSGMTSLDILREIVAGSHREVEVRIPEGATVYEIDNMLSGAGVIKKGSLVAFNASSAVEGTLFPDTYKFFTDSNPRDVAQKCKENFAAKVASSSVDVNTDKGKTDLILASIVEKEVPGIEDQKTVAGILKKRLKARIPLQVDATVCYVKEAASFPVLRPCYPLTPLDFKIDSAYNTYLRLGLPPGPIGNPGIQAITAVLQAESSPYWFYLSEQKSGRTIYSRTLDEQSTNRRKYLIGN